MPDCRYLLLDQRQQVGNEIADLILGVDVTPGLGHQPGWEAIDHISIGVNDRLKQIVCGILTGYTGLCAQPNVEQARARSGGPRYRSSGRWRT
jgi:hypothetical protein